MNEHEFDRRLTAALRDAASTTPRNPRALEQVVRRAGPARAGGPRRNLVVGLAAASLVAVGTVGVWLVRPNPNPAPAASSDGGGDGRAVLAAPPDADDLPRSGTVDSPLLYDDATLLSQLYVNFGVGALEDQSRTRMSGTEYEVDDAAMAACLSDRGFEYHPDPPGASATWLSNPRYVLSPHDFAAQYGFGVAAELVGSLPSEYYANERWNEYLWSLSSDRQQLFFEAESDCRLAHSNLGELPIADQQRVSAGDYAFAQLKVIVFSDERVVHELHQWQACMGAAGFVVDDPATIAQQFYTATYELEPWNAPFMPGSAEYDAAQSILAEEIAMATVHADCRGPYDEALHQAVTDNFETYKSILESAIESGVQSDAVGFAARAVSGG